MGYQEVQPSKTLSKYIEAYWFFSNELIVEQQIPIMPDGCMDLIFDVNTQDILVCGSMTSARTVTIRPRQKLFGVRFCPGILPVIIGLSAEALQDTIILLKDANSALYKKIYTITTSDTPAQMAEACTALLEKELAGRETHKIIQQIIAKIPLHSSVEELAGSVGVSVRQLERIFRQYVGLTPKRFLKIKRFQQIQKNIGKGHKFSQLSLEYGYVDQSHMNKEYKQLALKTPTGK